MKERKRMSVLQKARADGDVLMTNYRREMFVFMTKAQPKHKPND